MTADAVKAKSRAILDRGAVGYISYDAIPTPSADLADRYIEKKRQLRSLDSDIRNKICAHRNNSVIKYLEAISLFECIEVDVVLMKGTAMVHHDIDDPSGLPLELLLSLPTSSSKRLWLDVKNLSEENVSVLLDVLNKFHRTAEDTLVEISASAAGSGAATLLSEAGYTVSYYLPTELAVKCSSGDVTAECATFAVRVERDLQSQFQSLSFDVRASRFVSGLNIPSNVSLAAWDLHADTSELRDRTDLNKYNMFIVPFKSDYHH
jgi:hypothetical protein